MVNLDLYISELLIEHDCVIIPGFGGIVTNYRSSFLNPAHHTFSPPSKKLAFNASLRSNDGLLANHLCTRLAVTYQEANNMINSFVERCMTTLTSGKKLLLEKIGEIYFDQEHNLQFIPDTNINYLKSSFGLYTIHSPAIKRSEHVEEGVPFKSVQRNINRSKQPKTVFRIIEVISVAAMLVFLVLNPNVIRRLNQQAASLNPFEQPLPIELPSAKQNAIIETDESLPAVIESKKENAFAIPAEPISKDDNTTAFDMPKGNAELPADRKEAPVINLKSEVALTETKETTTAEIKEASVSKVTSPATTTGKMYYVIGGCFGVFENAENFRDQLISEGFQAAIIGQNDRGLHMVSFFSSNNMQRANEELVLIKEKAQASAWMFRK